MNQGREDGVHPPKKNARRRAKLNRNEPYYCAICEESLLTKGTKSLARTPFIVRVNATPGFSTDSVPWALWGV